MKHILDFKRNTPEGYFKNQGVSESTCYDQHDLSDKLDNQGMFTRRNFVKSTATITGGVLAGANILDTNAASIASKNKIKERRWIDTHIHVGYVDSDGKKKEREFEYLLEVLDRCDADLRLVISPAPALIKTTDPETMLKANRMIYDMCRLAPDRLYGCCFVMPQYLEESIRVMKICFEDWGFVQLGEMEQYSHNFKMNDSNTEKVVRLAAKYDVPVQVHCGTWWCKGSKPGSACDGLNQLGELIDIAERVPEAKYILAHTIGDAGPTSGCASLANMYLDILSGVFSEFPQNFWVEICNFQSPALQRALCEIPIDRLICGTDWTTRIGPPFQSYGTMYGFKERDNPFPPNVGSFVKFLSKAGATEKDIHQIGFENARELLKLL